MRGRTKLITAPVKQLITTDDAKTHLREDASANDAYIDDLVLSATSMFESETEKQLLTATWEYYLDAFPTVINLPYGPVQSVVSIKYYDTDGTEQTLSTSDYDVAIEGNIARIQSKTAGWPTTDEDTLNAVIVQYTAGYGDDPYDVPQDIISAVRLILGDLYDKREDFAMKRGYVKRVADLYRNYHSQ